ncbi:hypothetical protein ACFL2D_00725 [Patescibacteria group bacterium]
MACILSYFLFAVLVLLGVGGIWCGILVFLDIVIFGPYSDDQAERIERYFRRDDDQS